MKRKLQLLIALIAIVALAIPAGAITNGEPDGEEHPYVGQLFFYVPDDFDSRFDDPGSWFNCSGTLISPTVVVDERSSRQITEELRRRMQKASEYEALVNGARTGL